MSSMRQVIVVSCRQHPSQISYCLLACGALFTIQDSKSMVGIKSVEADDFYTPLAYRKRSNTTFDKDMDDCKILVLLSFVLFCFFVDFGSMSAHLLKL